MVLQLNRLKDIIYDLVLKLATLGVRRKTNVKKVLIVRVDEIGDYILWRRFLKELAGAERFRGHEIHFCGNRSWKALFDLFDAGFAQRAIWVDKRAFKKEMGYRRSFLRDIYQQHYDVVINPTFSRDKRNDDAIVMAARAPENIGMVSNLETVRDYEKGYDRGLYNQLFDLKEKYVFEFYRNKSFAGFVTGIPSSINNTRIPADLLPIFNMPLPEKYFVVFPGSRSKARIWPTEHFLAVSNYLYERFGYTTVVCGAESDAAHAARFFEQYRHPCVDLVNKTSLTEMLTVLKHAQCLVSVDTGSVHLAAAVGCTVYGIFNGGQYKRFAPYPIEVADNIYAIYPKAIAEVLKDPQVAGNEYEFVTNVPYHTVSAEQVIQAIKEHQ